ncbi:MAG: hypothetical protein SNJ74_07385 [Fimbriimonadaceae bacterium]
MLERAPSYTFLSLESICARVAETHRSEIEMLDDEKASDSQRRQAFLSLVGSIEREAITLRPAYAAVPARQRATAALYALVAMTPLNDLADREIERLTRRWLPRDAPAQAVVEDRQPAMAS